MKTILVTGGAGFIGSNFVRWLLRHHDYSVINFDKLTYAGNLDNLLDVRDDPRYRFVRGDICDAAAVEAAMAEADAVVNFAAETHVDRSLMDPGAFIQTDVYGVFVLLEAARKRGVERFLHISTDEVYGPRFPENPGRESDALTPANPYAASKAGGEMMCFAYHRTYGLPVLVTRSRNNIGPYQHPEKAVPLFVTNALDDQPLPVYGEGLQVRDRLYVEDNCEAIDLVLHHGAVGEAYNIGADNERPNIEVVEAILSMLEKPRSLIRFVEDRQGHDARYCIDTAKIRSLGWQPRHDFEAALGKTVAWYRENRWWWEKVKSGDYAAYYQRQYGERLSRARAAQ
ncbi:MAG TPA: dTDP-glucose 4,6-dehydratase [Dehalococcoidia bacterium]|nr:dTDP-glucose 4,6-dehydratase [Dehalococcoidia bacterium]